MIKNQPFQLSSVLPRGVSAGEFYTAVFVLVAMVCVATIILSFRRRHGVGAKIRAIQERRNLLRSDTLAPKKRNSPEMSIHFMRAFVMKLQILQKSQIGKTQSRLIEAGFRSKDALYVMAFFSFMLPLLLGIAGFVFMQVNAAHVAAKWRLFNYIWPVLGMYIGLKLPGLFVSYKRRKRYANIQMALPDVLDLMTICAEAGLSLTTMLERVSRELGIAYPEMAEELAMTSIEIGFLPDRNKALSNLAERCTLQEVRGIVSVLIQTEKYGTPIAQALRVLSSEFRQSRMLRAEQKAARLPALMTVPMILFILPTLFIVIIAPAVVKLLNTM